MIEIKEYVDVKSYSTLKIGGQFRYFAIIRESSDLPLVCEKAKEFGAKIFILGGGSNIVFHDGVLPIFAVKNEIKGFGVVNETEEFVDIKIGAGEIWSNIVKKTVDMNLWGFEALSAIPGTVGATPVQNVGAYGSEVKDTILEVEVFDIENCKIFSLSNKECKFGYRDSIFKNEAKGKYIIVSVIFRLKKQDGKYPLSCVSHPSLRSLIKNEVAQDAESDICRPASLALSYPGVKKYFEKIGIENPTLKDIHEAIIEIRKEKLPDPKEIPNIGSFFKNPIVSKEQFANICTSRTGTDIPHFDIGNNMIKIPAGWLIENAGLKGISFGGISVYDKNALVLVNKNSSSFEEVNKARDEIVKKIKEKFGIVLEQEPEMI